MELVQGGSRVRVIVPMRGELLQGVIVPMRGELLQGGVIVPMWGELLQGEGDCTYVG